MTTTETQSNHRRLVRLIRRLAREEAHEVLDEHLSDYEHKEKQLEDWEANQDELIQTRQPRKARRQ